MSRFSQVGTGRILRDNRTGQIVVDEDSIRRPSVQGDFAGEDDDFEGDDDDDFEGDDDDDFEGDDDDDFEGDEDDDLEGEQSIDDLGRSRKKKKKKKKKGKGGRPTRSNRQSRSSNQARRSTNVKWGSTVVGGSQTLAGAGAATVQIRLQHDFKAKDITFDGSANGSRVTAIYFGELPVFTSPAGVPVSVFAANSQMRRVLDGQTLRAGLDITVQGTLSGAGDFVATLMGSKPISNRC